MIGIALLAAAGRMIWRYLDRFSVGEWFGVAWLAIVVPTLWIGLPAVALRERRRRRALAAQNAEHPKRL